MGLKDFIMAVNLQAAVVEEPETPPEQGPSFVAIYKTVSNKYVDIVFDQGVYADDGGVNPVTTANFSIVNFFAGGTTNVSVASVKRNTHYNSASAANLIGGESVIRVFLTLTGTPTSVESFRIKCSNIYSPTGVPSTMNTPLIKLNITPLILWDYLETGSWITTGLGISTLNDVMGIANLTQTVDADRPLDADGVIYFDRDNSEFLTGGNVDAVDYQKGTSFTIIVKKLNALNSSTTGWVVANRSNDPGVTGWSINVGTGNQLFFVLNDGTLQGFVQYDAFSGSGERDVLFFVNNNGTLNLYDSSGNVLGTTGDATGIGVISYAGISLLVGRRGNNAASYFEGWWEKMAIVNKAMSLDERTDFIENMN